MKKVAIYLISDGIGGAEQVVWQTILGLCNNEAIYLIVNNEIASIYDQLLPKNRILNIGDIFLHSKKKFAIIRFLLKNRFYNCMPSVIRSKSRLITNFINENEVEIIHSHLDFALYSSLCVKKQLTNIKVFNTVHGALGLVDNKLLKPALPLSLLNYGSVDKLIFVSNYVYNLYKERNIQINEFEIIYNGIDNSFDGLFCRTEKNGPKFKILFVGGAKYVKGYDLLVETVKLLSISTFKNSFHVVVLGLVTEQSDFVKRIKKNGLENYFILKGFVTPPLHLNHFKSADILFMPSRTEALPLAAIEAISLDLFVIATNVGGLPELIQNGENGFLADLDPSIFADRIIYIFNNYAILTNKARELNKEIIKKFDAIKMCNITLALYKN